MKISKLLVVFTALIAFVTVPAHAVFFDLTDDWTDSASGGPWSFHYLDPNNYLNVLGLIAPTVRGSDPWAAPPASYGDLPGFFKSNGAEQFGHGWAAGDVIAHSDFSTPIAAIWTSPFAATITITGEGWQTRGIGRDTHYGVLAPGYGFEYSYLGSSYSTPTSFPASGTLTVAAGDQVILFVRSMTGFGDYVGLSLHIEATPTGAPVPDASDMPILLALSGLTLAAFRRCPGGKK